jgi:threonylcarbamoyladenosine tRNA methylthiotransferase MtaB
MNQPQVITFGCRLNSFESEIMRDHARKAGIDNTIIFNTCAVTAKAQRQARQAIRKARRENPKANIIVTGCAAQIDAAAFGQMDEVSLVLGNEEKLQAENYQSQNFGLEQFEKIRVNDIMSVTETAPQLIDGFAERARAFVQIQNGCDHRCTFCIIPYGRGNSRSVPAGEVIDQIKRLVDNGYKEIVLTGVDITAYGADLPGQLSLGKLTQKILDQVPDLPRLRLSSIDSVEVDKHLLNAIGNEERLMPHIHLSLQAGDNMILKRMKRRHLREQSVEFCTQLKQTRKDIVFGADLIAGFPTETDEMFENTLALIDDCHLTYLHVFPYSPRPGTPAAKMPQVNDRTIRERAALLRQAGEKNLNHFLISQTGRQVSALVETPGTARSPHFAPIELAQNGLPGSLVNVRITRSNGGKLQGVVI